MYILFFQIPDKYGADEEKSNRVSKHFQYSCAQLFAVSTLFLKSAVTDRVNCFPFGMKTKINILKTSFVEMQENAATLILSLLPSSGRYHVIWWRFPGCQATSHPETLTGSNQENASALVQYIDGTR